jgi:hypothetical protein
MSKLTFRGTTIDYPDLRRKEAAVFVRLHCSCDMSDKILETMEWEAVPDNVSSAKLKGFLACEKIVITPTEKKLKDFEMELQCSRISKFEFSRTQEGEKPVTRLKFVCIVEQQGAIGYIENWMRSVGEAPAALAATYVEQEDLPLEGGDGPQATEEQRKAAMEA